VVFLHPWDLEMSTKTCSNNMVSPNDHVVMNHQNQTPNKWHMMPCSLQPSMIRTCTWALSARNTARARRRRATDQSGNSQASRWEAWSGRAGRRIDASGGRAAGQHTVGAGGGPKTGIGVGRRGWVRKTLCFWQKRSPNCDFLYFIVLPPYPLPKIYD
jgi:hypothetical protein